MNMQNASSLTVSNNQLVDLPAKTWVIALVWVDGFLDGTRTCDYVALPCRIEYTSNNRNVYHAFVPALGKVKAVYPSQISQVLNMKWAQAAQLHDAVRVLATNGSVYTGRIIMAGDEMVCLELDNFSRAVNVPRWQIIDRESFAREYDTAFSMKASA